MYDIIFDHDDDYVANGLQMQAHSPYCVIGSLPKKDYYDIKNYKEKKS